ncbi:MAG: phage terminase large subunit [Ardenticatenaceae bacterium]|nr:phage terminase large subunit [Ardenticatenaceae bacterium]
MPATHRLLLHHDGPALWSQHKPLAEILELQATTPELVWSGTYQGTPTPPGGYIFKRSWWPRANRYDPTDERELERLLWARYISFDTGQKDKESSDNSAHLVGELWTDYRMIVRRVEQKKLEFPYLVDEITAVSRHWNHDDKLHGVIIEDKSSGTSALQTLRASAPDWLARLLIPFLPTTDKVTRASQAAVWCKNGSVLLPVPGPAVPWLVDFEDELFSFPQVAHDDRTDTLSQMILFLENILSAGYLARGGNTQ